MSSRRQFIQLMPVASMVLLTACSEKPATTAQPAAPAPAAPPAPAPSAPSTMASAAAALPMLDEKQPTALKLGYVSDATRADAKTFKTYATGQMCGACALYQGSSGDAAGPCAIFPGARVAAAGWCASFAKKAT